jgi:ATP-dependent DNA ligase
MFQQPAPMLAHLESRLPAGDSWRYEPKLDGFRGLLWRWATGQVQLLSRNSRDLGPWFPELIQAGKTLPDGTLLDGEIVICDESGSADFGRLQERLSTARKSVFEVARQRPAVLVVFDLLEFAGTEFVNLALGQRRRELEQLIDGLHPCLQLVSQTPDIRQAQDWLTLPNLEGVVAKRIDRPYVAGRARDWVKVKRHRSVDCVVIGVAGEADRPKLVLALRHTDGNLHHFALSRPVPRELARPVAELLAEAGPEEAAIRSRWQHDAIPLWRRLPPRLVCEVRVSNLDRGRWARFPAVFLRWRADRSVDDCGLDQLLA